MFGKMLIMRKIIIHTHLRDEDITAGFEYNVERNVSNAVICITDIIFVNVWVKHPSQIATNKTLTQANSET